MKRLSLSISIFLLLIFFSTKGLKAQTQAWSLDSCINYALINNIQIKQSELSIRSAQSNLKKSKAAVLPSLNAGGGYNLNYGTSVDPFTYQFVDYNTNSANIGFSSSLDIFNGMRNYNTYEKSRYDFMAAMKDVEKFKNDISLNIALAYMNVLLSNELVNNAKAQIENTKLQLDKTQKLVEAGSLPQGNLLEVEAQQASEQLNLVNAQNQLINAKLNLAQMLDLDSVRNFEILVPQIDNPEQTELLGNIDDIYNNALKLPQVESAELKLKSAEKNLSISRSYMSPSLSVSASYGTGYSSARKKYALVEGRPVEQEYPYNEQLKDNMSTTISLRLNIPIFNKYATRNAIENSIVNVENQRYQMQLVKNQLYKDIQKAYTDAIGAYEKFLAAKKNYEALKESFVYTQKKFDVGMVTAVDFNLAKTNLIKAESNMASAKYEYIFKKNILNFYQGKPFSIK